MSSHMGASINRGPQNKPKYIMVFIIGTTKMGPLICGNSHRMYGMRYMVKLLSSNPGAGNWSCHIMYGIWYIAYGM